MCKHRRRLLRPLTRCTNGRRGNFVFTPAPTSAVGFGSFESLRGVSGRWIWVRKGSSASYIEAGYCRTDLSCRTTNSVLAPDGPPIKIFAFPHAARCQRSCGFFIPVPLAHRKSHAGRARRRVGRGRRPRRRRRACFSVRQHGKRGFRVWRRTESIHPRYVLRFMKLHASS